MPRRRLWLFVLLCLLAPAAVWAQEGFNAHLLTPSYFSGRYLTFEDARTLSPGAWAAGALLGYANAPVEVRTDNERTNGVLDNLLTLDAFGGYGVHDMVSIGAGLPVHLLTRGRSFGDLGNADDATTRQWGAALGDLRLAAKVRLLEEGIWPMGVAVTPFITFPTGNAARLLGEGRVTAGLTATYEIDLAWVRLGLNGGWHYRGGSDVLGTRVRNGFPLGAALTRDVWENINLSLELHGEAYESDNGRRFAGSPLELDLVGRYALGDGLRLLAGGGPGVTSGVGSPDFRLFVGLDYQPVPVAAPPPSAGDLRIVVQDENGQRLEAEIGLEGPELRMGSTVQGVFVLTDLAPGTYTARASRPDYETGVLSVNVNAGQVAIETIVLHKPPTRLNIVVLDAATGAHLPAKIIFNPGQPGENTVTTESGEYSQPLEPGAITFTAEAAAHEAVMTTVDVAPDKITTATVHLRKKLVKRGQIFFDLNSAVLRPESNATLDDIAVQIKSLKPTRVEIEGHCSAEGSDEYNLELSRRRGYAVRDYLIRRGIDAQILEVRAFGKTRPIATNDTEEGRERNRRVEFILTEEPGGAEE